MDANKARDLTKFANNKRADILKALVETEKVKYLDSYLDEIYDRIRRTAESGRTSIPFPFYKLRPMDDYGIQCGIQEAMNRAVEAALVNKGYIVITVTGPGDPPPSVMW